MAALAVRHHRLRALHLPSPLLLYLCVSALLLACVQSDLAGKCDEPPEHTCDAVLNEAMKLVLDAAANITASAVRASDMLSATSYQCCYRFPPIRIRSALVRQLQLVSMLWCLPLPPPLML